MWLGGFGQGHVPAARLSQPSFPQARRASQRAAVRPASALGQLACRVRGLSWGRAASSRPGDLACCLSAHPAKSVDSVQFSKALEIK